MTRSRLVTETVSALIDSTDLRIFTALSARPLGSNQKLAELAEVSPHTCRRRLATLMERKILLRVAARVNYSGLGLQIVPVLAQVSAERLPYAEKACDLHPYTRYRVRCLGSTNGLFMLFAIPKGTEFQLIEFFDALQSREIVRSYQISSSVADPVYTQAKFSAYNPQTDTWRFDLEKWEALLNSEPKEEPLRKPAESSLAKLDLRDLTILRLLTIDARKEGKSIAEESGAAEYHVSRRLKFLFENNFVVGHDILVGRQLFRFAPGALFECNCHLQTTRKVANAMMKLPFQSSLFPTDRGFILFVGLPTPQFTQIGAALLSRSDSIGVMWTDYDTSMRYYFDESPFLEERKEWNTDHGYVMKEPLAQLLKYSSA